MRKVILTILFTLTLCQLYSQFTDNTEIRQDGIVIPKVDHTTIINPSEGQLIYDINTLTYLFYDGTNWRKIESTAYTPPSDERIVIINGLATRLEPVDYNNDGIYDDGFITIYENDFINKSILSGTSYSINKEGSNVNLSQTSITLDCDDVGTVIVEIHKLVNGSYIGYASSYVIVASNGVCPY